ncbi:MAG: c-type cytochrome biogenesis protein CcmI [Pseudomonadota bacterium]
MFLWFLILSVLLLGIALAFSGLWRIRRETVALSEREQVLYQSRLSEIDADFDLGRIDAESRDAAKTEQSRIFIKHATSGEQSNSLSKSQTFAFIAAGMIFVPLFSVALYSGTSTFPVQGYQAQTASQKGTASLEELLSAAETQLAKNPDDIRGWRVVAPVYMRSGEFGKAVIAFRNILRLEPNNMEAKRALGEVLVLSAKNTVSDEAMNLFKELVAANEDDARALYFVALGEMQRENLDPAKAIWEGLRDNAKGDEPWLPAVLQRIREVNSLENPLPKFTAEQREQVNAMVAGLAERLQEEPDDKAGWERLIRSYLVLNRMDDARSSLETARKQFAEDETLITKLENMIRNHSENKELQ